ncbi:diguanylate cyclase domain-containing protein [Sulfurimonas sp.]|uniref:diguanylate cyclase domain-containing protein n=1 Tax=Sulfurimonas sp. TaxID=2022749 RepID=UPI003562568A
MDKQIVAPNLLRIIDSIEEGRFEIAAKWIEVPSVVSVLKNRKISTNKFKDNFGVQIIEYFIAVVREEQMAGDCPIMSKLVNYLLDKAINPKEVFNICMGFRKMLLTYIFEKNLNGENSIEIMNELADIFDANLSGVLDIFTDLYKRQQERIIKSQEKDIKYKQVSQIINFIYNKIIIVKDGKIVMANKAFLELTNSSSIKEFYKKHADHIKDENNHNKKNYCIGNIDDWLKDICENNNSFNVNAFNYKMEKVFTYNGRVTLLPDNDEEKYIISFNNVSTFIDQNSKLKKDLEVDKLTGMYNYIKFENILHEEVSKLENVYKRSALAVIDIDSLKSKEESITVSQYNKIVLKAAKVIQKNICSDSYAAHLHDTIFAILLPVEDQQDSYDWCNKLFVELNKIGERVNFALSCFDYSENVNHSLRHALSLVEKAKKLKDNAIVTDFDNVHESELLENQEKFISLLEKSKCVDMTTYYKELPILSSNEIVYSDNCCVKVRTSKKQLISIEPNKNIYFKLPNLDNIKAKIKDIDKENKTITLHNFKESKESPIIRKYFRIKAEENIQATIIYEDKAVTTTLIDLNSKTLSLLCTDLDFLEVGLEVKVYIELYLKDEIHKINSPGKIMKIVENEDNYKIIIECFYSMQDESVINNYISLRQLDIVKEIHDKSL